MIFWRRLNVRVLMDGSSVSVTDSGMALQMTGAEIALTDCEIGTKRS